MTQKIVIKLGSNILTTPEGKLDLNQLRTTVDQIAKRLDSHSDKILIVTSAAITCGSEAMSITPESIPEKQAAASVGQLLLLQEYARYFSLHNIPVGQLLVTQDNFKNESTQKNILNTINTLWNENAIPIINENDSVSTEEISFGDNDLLSALVSILVEADKLILLSNIDGVFTAHPQFDEGATLINELSQIDDELIENTSAQTDTRSRGGMKSKLKAAKHAHENNIDVHIANGRTESIITKLLNNEAHGTTILKKGA